MTAPTDGAPVCAVARCQNPTHQHAVCWGCLDTLRRDLRELPELLPELEVTLTRQDQAGDRPVPDLDDDLEDEPRTKDSPIGSAVLPFRPRAADVGRYLHAVLDHWTTHLLTVLDLDEQAVFGTSTVVIPAQRTVGELADRRWVAHTPSSRTLELAAWLERHPDTIGVDPDAGALVEGIRWAVEDVRRVIWPRQLVYCGPCECPKGQLYAPAGAQVVRCQLCGTRWGVDECVRYFRAQAEGVLLSAEDMSRALPRLAADIAAPPLTVVQIRGFVRRGRLAEHRPDPRTWTVDKYGQPVPPPPRYKVGQVIELMYALLEEEQARQERRARRQSGTAAARVSAAHERFKQTLRGGFAHAH